MTDGLLVAPAFLGKVSRVVTPLQDQLVALDYQGVVNYPVEKILVMTSDDKSLVLILQVVSDPSPSPLVKMVSGLVQQGKAPGLGKEGR